MKKRLLSLLLALVMVLGLLPAGALAVETERMTQEILVEDPLTPESSALTGKMQEAEPFTEAKLAAAGTQTEVELGDPIEITLSAVAFMYEGLSRPDETDIEKTKVKVYAGADLNYLISTAARGLGVYYVRSGADPNEIMAIESHQAGPTGQYIWRVYVDGEGPKSLNDTLDADSKVVNLVYQLKAEEGGNSSIRDSVDQTALDAEAPVTVDTVDGFAADKAWLTANKLLGENAEAGHITSDLTLPIAAPNGSAIEWASSDSWVIDTDGTVYREDVEEDTPVTLTPTFTFEHADGTKTTEALSGYSFTVIALSEDEKTVLEALDYISFWEIAGNNEGRWSVTQDLNLFTTLEDYPGVAISWASSQPEVVAADGKVTRPLLGQEAVRVNLTATVKKGSAEREAEPIAIEVLPITVDTQVVAEAKNQLTIGKTDDVTDHFQLPSSLSVSVEDEEYTVRVRWTTSDRQVVTKDGQIIRPAFGQPSASATLTATITSGDETETKQFPITVAPYTQEEQAGRDAAKAAAETALASIMSAEDIVYENLYDVVDQLDEAEAALDAAKDAGWIEVELEEFEGYSKIGAAKDAMAELPRDITISVLGASLASDGQTITYLEDDFLPKIKVKVPADMARNPMKILLAINRMYPELGLDTTVESVKIQGLGPTDPPAGGKILRWKYFINGIDGQELDDPVSHGQALKWVFTGLYDDNTGFPENKDSYDTPYEKEEPITYDLVDPTVNAANALTIADILGDNAEADQITADLTLPTVAENTATIQWVSSNPEVIDNTGALVNYPLLTVDQKVTLTATVSMKVETPSISTALTITYPDQVKSFDLVVRASDATDDERAVQIALGDLDLGDLSSLTDDILLPATGSLDTEITWTSSNPAVLTAQGNIHRPAAGDENVSVTLTATARKNEASGQKDFQVTVKAHELGGQQAVAADKAALSFEAIRGENIQDNAITKSLTLPQAGDQGSSIRWSASPECIAQDGTLTRPANGEEPVAVALTATIEKDGARDTWTIDLTLLPMTVRDELIANALLAFAQVPNADDITEATRDELQAKDKIKAAKDAYQAATDGGVLPAELPGYDRVQEADQKMRALPAYITISIMGDIDDKSDVETMGYFHEKEKVRVPAGHSLMSITTEIAERDGSDVILTFGGGYLDTMYRRSKCWMYGTRSDVIGSTSGAGGYRPEHGDVIYWYQVYTQQSALAVLEGTGYDEAFPDDAPYTLDLVTEQVDKSELAAALTLAKGLKENDYRDYGDWKGSWEALQTVLPKAQAIYDDTQSIQYDVDRICDQLTAAIDDLELVAPDKTELNAEIDTAEQLSQEDYQEGWEAVQQALSTARIYAQSPYSSEKEIAEALAELKRAVIALVPVGNTTDKTLLREALAEAATLDEAEYTEISWRKLSSALTYAQIIYEKGKAAQSEADAAVSILTQAIDALLPSEPATVPDKIAVSIESAGEHFVGTSEPWKVMDMAYAGRTGELNKTAFMEEALSIIADKKSTITDLERTAIVLTSLGVNISKIADGAGGTIDLLDMIVNDSRTFEVNALTFALIALDSGNYSVPDGAKWTREKLIQELLDTRLADRDDGWAWNREGTVSDIDMTAMVITALAPYYLDAQNGQEAGEQGTAIITAVDEAMTYLKSKQQNNGAFGAGAEEGATTGNSNSTAMVILAATALGRDAATEFKKQTRPWPGGPVRTTTIIDGLYTFQTDDRLFGYTTNKLSDEMATEQVYRALLAYQNYLADSLPHSPYRFQAPDQGSVVEKDALREKVTELSAIEETGYTSESWSVFQKALEAAEACLASMSVTQKDVDAAYVQLMKAYRGLVTTSGGTFVDTEAPAIITTARNETVNSQTYTFQATAQDDQEGVLPVYVTCNGSEVTGVNHYFTMQLKNGSNEIVITAEDYSNNITTQTYTVVYRSGSSSGRNITVSFTLHGDNDETWIETTSYTVSSGSTVWDVFSKALTENQLGWKEKMHNYISGIQIPGTDDYLSEFDRGQNSGWMYTVNGTYPSVGLRSYKLSDGDDILWHYTEDYTQEEGAENWNPADKLDQRAAEAVEERIDAIGTVTKDSGKKIEAARKAYDALTDTQKKLVENYAKLTAAEKEFARLTGSLPFTDVEGHWALESIKYAYINDLMNGTDTDAFSPDGTLNRAMLATILYRLEGEPVVKAKNTYADVADGTWYTDAVVWASENGIVTGYGNGKFGPADNITREQIATMLYRYSEFKKYDVTAVSDLKNFTDAGSISTWALGAIQWANAEQLINGRSTTTIVPGGNATRAEAATILMRFCENIAQ